MEAIFVVCTLTICQYNTNITQILCNFTQSWNSDRDVWGDVGCVHVHGDHIARCLDDGAVHDLLECRERTTGRSNRAEVTLCHSGWCCRGGFRTITFATQPAGGDGSIGGVIGGSTGSGGEPFSGGGASPENGGVFVAVGSGRGMVVGASGVLVAAGAGSGVAVGCGGSVAVGGKGSVAVGDGGRSPADATC